MKIVYTKDLDEIYGILSIENFFLNAPGLDEKYKCLYRTQFSTDADSDLTYCEGTVCDGRREYNLKFEKKARDSKIHLSIGRPGMEVVYRHSSNKYRFSILNDSELKSLEQAVKEVAKKQMTPSKEKKPSQDL